MKSQRKPVPFFLSHRAAAREPNHALERAATRRALTFQMIETVSVEAGLALGGGCSSFSR